MPSYSRQVKLPGKSSQELFDTISTHIDQFISKSSFGKVDLERDPKQKEFRIKASMFSATLSCLEEHLKLDAQLSLLASPFRSKIDEAIDRWIGKTFRV